MITAILITIILFLLVLLIAERKRSAGLIDLYNAVVVESQAWIDYADSLESDLIDCQDYMIELQAQTQLFGLENLDLLMYLEQLENEFYY